MLRARHGGAYVPPPATGRVFADVPASHWAAAWIEQLFAERITNGCAGNPLRFCPESVITAWETGVFLSRL